MLFAKKVKAKSLMLSMLLRRYLTHREQFLTEHRTPFLVWERGVWKPPLPDETTMASTPSAQEAKALSDGSDLLCFQLGAPPGQAAVFRVGRDPSAEVVINDATVSRAHVELQVDRNGAWMLEVAKGGQVEYRGRVLEPKSSVPLASGEQLKLGNVRVTFYLAAEWVARVQKEIQAVT